MWTSLVRPYGVADIVRIPLKTALAAAALFGGAALAQTSDFAAVMAERCSACIRRWQSRRPAIPTGTSPR